MKLKAVRLELAVFAMLWLQCEAKTRCCESLADRDVLKQWFSTDNDCASPRKRGTMLRDGCGGTAGTDPSALHGTFLKGYFDGVIQ